ncbi:MAG: hypothetical protein M3485_00725 [Pseudomonadota bacterium]|nr:hypothetical protein [Pseudomonadota bacterium]
MNRKFHNSLLALSTTGLAMVLGLMAATPVLPTPENGATPAVDLARAQLTDARVLHAKVELRNADETGVEAITHTATLLADIAAEAALAAALAQLEVAAQAKADAEAAAPVRSQRRSRARNALATPYFSFAHGLRGTGA